MKVDGTCPACGGMYEPFDIVEAWVEVFEPITEIDERGIPQGYEPVGNTNVNWDLQQSIGYGCSDCGTVIITRTRIKIGNEEFILHPATDDRFGR